MEKKVCGQETQWDCYTGCTIEQYRVTEEVSSPSEIAGMWISIAMLAVLVAVVIKMVWEDYK